MYCENKECNGPIQPNILFFGQGYSNEWIEALNNI